jgi:hypothetical protein
MYNILGIHSHHMRFSALSVSISILGCAQSVAANLHGRYCGVSTILDDKLALSMEFDDETKTVLVDLTTARESRELDTPVNYTLSALDAIILVDFDDALGNFLRRFSIPLRVDSFVHLYNNTSDSIDTHVQLSFIMSTDMRLDKSNCRAPLLSGVYTNSESPLRVRFFNNEGRVQIHMVAGDGIHEGEYPYSVSASGAIILPSPLDAGIPSDLTLQVGLGDSDALVATYTDADGRPHRDVLGFGSSLLAAFEAMMLESVDDGYDADTEEGPFQL